MMQNLDLISKQKHFSEASLQDLMQGWKLNTQKILSLLEHTFILRLQIQDRIHESLYADSTFIEALQGYLRQFKILTEKRDTHEVNKAKKAITHKVIQITKKTEKTEKTEKQKKIKE